MKSQILSLDEDITCHVDANKEANTKVFVSSELDSPTHYSNAAFVKLAETNGAICLSSCAIEYNCLNCSDCKPIRINTKRFKPSRSQRKVLKRNSDITFGVYKAEAIDELIVLYMKYETQRFPERVDQKIIDEENLNFSATLSLTANDIVAVAKDRDGVILGASIFKCSEDGFAGVDRVYDMDASKKRSLGVFLDLKIIEFAAENDIPYLYLGATNLNSETAYLTRYAAAELFNRQTRSWVPIERNPASLDHIP